MDFLERMTEAGERSRVVDHLTMRLLIVDASLAFTPIAVGRWDEWILLHRSALLAALTMDFETVWEWAETLPVEAGGVAPIARAPHLTVDDRRVLISLASELHDEVIARQIGVTHRTVLRRVNRARSSTRWCASPMRTYAFATDRDRATGNGRAEVDAQVMRSEMYAFPIELRAMTQGRGRYSMTFSHYEEVPAHVAQKIIDAHSKEHAQAAV